MKAQAKYVILLFAFIGGLGSLSCNTIGAGIASAGAFIAFALIEIQDVKILNSNDDDDDEKPDQP